MPDPVPARLLVAHDLNKSFPARDGLAEVPVLRGINLAVGPGELVCIVGPSGSGKSTLLYCLAGLERCGSALIVGNRSRSIPEARQPNERYTNMTTSTSDLMTSSLLEIFGERDRSRRRATMERTYASDIVFNDAEGSVKGLERIDEKVTELLAGVPADWVFRAASPAVGVADLGRVSWEFGPVDAPVVKGMDIALVAEGRITALYTVLEPQ